MNTQSNNRLLSLDVLRGIIILTMLFVNDVASVSGIPAWMRHAKTFHDGMTFVDLVFPAFLFMVGMAVPFSVGRRLAAGDSFFKVWGHVCVRAVSLIILGFFEVNADSMADGGPVSPELWALMMISSVILIWGKFGGRKNDRSMTILILRGIGWLALCASALLFKSEKGFGVTALEPHWWGILGLIGWAYLAACCVYIPSRNRPEAILGAMALFLAFSFVEQAGLLNGMPGIRDRWNPISSFAPHTAIVLAGILLGRTLLPGSEQTTVFRKIRWALLFAAGLYCAGMLFHTLRHLNQIFIISKNLATVPWCLRCCAYTAFLWVITYLVIDIWGMKFGAGFLANAGQNALFAYILAPFIVSVVQLVGHLFAGEKDIWAFGNNFHAGLARSIIQAFVIVWLAGFSARRGFGLKL